MKVASRAVERKLLAEAEAEGGAGGGEARLALILMQQVPLLRPKPETRNLKPETSLPQGPASGVPWGVQRQVVLFHKG